jgi:PmbA protein
MLSSGPKVFLLREVMGLHMADPITGEFSLGGSGYLYENGRFSGPVRGVTIAGSVGDMLKAVSAAGDDLRWYGSVGAPSLLVTGLTVAGS